MKLTWNEKQSTANGLSIHHTEMLKRVKKCNFPNQPKFFAVLVSGRPDIIHKPASRLFMSCYWILTITVVATFTGNLTAFMTLKKTVLPLNSLKDLAARPDYQVGLAGGTSSHNLFNVRAAPTICKRAEALAGVL